MSASGLIDVHSHIVPRTLPADPTGGQIDKWPCLQCHSPTSATVLMGSRPFREIDERSWDTKRRIADMDRDGVAAQALSPMPELLSYWLDLGPATEFARYVNGAIAEMVASRPDRFHGLGSVPLQDPVRAAEELRLAKERFGLQGVEIGSNINGRYLGDRHFDPFFAAAEELGMAVFVHALHPLQAQHLAKMPNLVPFAAFPVDTALCIASLIMDGVPERFPRLRLGFSHGGGAFGPILHRMQHGWHASKGFDGKVAQPPKHYAARFFYDSLVYEKAYLAHLATHVAPGQIFAGTDYPYLIEERDPVAFIGGVAGDVPQGQTLWSGAARRFLGLDPA
ncbi:MAG TPA: amidohydrolase family protein [Vineibacter sp.]|nr:amidohydrolase family protein [Vineibacter sp.]